MLEDEQNAPATVAETPAAPAPEARISEKDMDKLAEKVGEAAAPKTDAERQEKADADLRAAQVKAYRRATRDKESNDEPEAADEKATPAKALPPEKAVKTDQKPTEEDKTAKAPPEDKPAAREIKQPQHWSADKKAVWDALPSEAKEYISQREQETHKAISSLGQMAKGMQPVAKTLESYRDVFDSKGLSFEAGMKQLLDAQRLLDRDPIAGLQAVARNLGVDLGHVMSGQRDPAMNHLQAQVEWLTEELNASRAEANQRQRQEAEIKESSMAKIVSDFATDKPDFDDLESDILANLSALRSQNPQMTPAEVLQAAYERAQWANPKTRMALMERQNKESEAKRLEQAKRAAEDARSARSINVSSSVDGGSEVDLLTLQRQAYRRAQNR